MNYKNYSHAQLISMLKQRDRLIVEQRDKSSFKTYLALVEETEQERRLRVSYQESTGELHKQVFKYKLLVGDAKPQKVVARI